MKRGKTLEEIQLEHFKDPKNAKKAVKFALQEFEKDGDIDSVLSIMRLTAQAQGGIASVAKKSLISRQALHSALSPNGNPKLRTFKQVLETLGFKMTFKPLRHLSPAQKNTPPKGRVFSCLVPLRSGLDFLCTGTCCQINIYMVYLTHGNALEKFA